MDLWLTAALRSHCSQLPVQAPGGILADECPGSSAGAGMSFYGGCGILWQDVAADRLWQNCNGNCAGGCAACNLV